MIFNIKSILFTIYHLTILNSKILKLGLITEYVLNDGNTKFKHTTLFSKFVINRFSSL